MPREVDHRYADRLPALGHRVAVARRAAGLSQETVAERAHLSRYGLQNIEGGRSNPRLTTLLALADALDVPLAELLG